MFPALVWADQVTLNTPETCPALVSTTTWTTPQGRRYRVRFENETASPITIFRLDANGKPVRTIVVPSAEPQQFRTPAKLGIALYNADPGERLYAVTPDGFCLNGMQTHAKAEDRTYRITQWGETFNALLTNRQPRTMLSYGACPTVGAIARAGRPAAKGARLKISNETQVRLELRGFQADGTPDAQYTILPGQTRDYTDIASPGSPNYLKGLRFLAVSYEGKCVGGILETAGEHDTHLRLMARVPLPNPSPPPTPAPAPAPTGNPVPPTTPQQPFPTCMANWNCTPSQPITPKPNLPPANPPAPPPPIPDTEEVVVLSGRGPCPTKPELMSDTRAFHPYPRIGQFKNETGEALTIMMIHPFGTPGGVGKLAPSGLPFQTSYQAPESKFATQYFLVKDARGQCIGGKVALRDVRWTRFTVR